MLTLPLFRLVMDLSRIVCRRLTTAFLFFVVFNASPFAQTLSRQSNETPGQEMIKRMWGLSPHDTLRSIGDPSLPPGLRRAQVFTTHPVSSAEYPRTGSFKATGSVDTTWVRYFRNRQLVPAQDEVAHVAVDSKGNVFVTGVAQGSSGSWDVVTIKYSPSGDTLWTRRDPTTATPILAIDKSGNAYVAGTSTGIHSQNQDYVTTKYDPNGKVDWIRWYNGPANGNDHLNALAIDSSGNIYVTGGSVGPSHPGHDYLATDFATIKYNAAGDTVWIRYWDGPDSLGDQATALAVDDSGNVYVSGASIDSLYSFPDNLPSSCATIKYNSAGDLVWASRYRRPRRDAHDSPIAIAVADSGAVYVGVNSFTRFDAMDGGFDFVTLKIDSRGDTVWSRVYDHAWDEIAALTADGSGNVYVTGNNGDRYFESLSSMVTIKYDRFGDSVWTRTYNAPGSQRDYASSLAVDPDGYIYLTGSVHDSTSWMDYAIIKFDPMGQIVWARTYNSPYNGSDYPASMALDATGNVVVTGEAWSRSASLEKYPTAAFATIKYASSGDSLWAQTYNEPRLLDADNRASGFDVDGNGNAYVTGTASYVINTSTAVTVKCNPFGDTVWTRNPMGLAGKATLPAFKTDAMGNVYLAIASQGYNTWYDDILTTKFTSNGDTAWSQRFDGPMKMEDAPNALALDESGNVYVTGSNETISNRWGCVTIKYSADGKSGWAKKFSSTLTGIDEGRAVAVDQIGNVYVAGFNYRGDALPDSSSDFLAIKYNPAGDTVWARRYNGSANIRDEANLVAVDEAGNVYVAGSANMDRVYTGSWTSSDFAVIKYNANGDTLWARTYNGPANRVDIPTSLAVDRFGSAFVTGFSQNSDRAYDCTTIKYSATGDTAWVRRSSQDSTGQAYVIVDAQGFAYVTYSGPDADSTNVTTKYSPSGAEEWTARFSHFAHVVGIRLDNERNVYVAGTALTSEGPKYAVVKYAQSPTYVKDGASLVPTSSALEQNYPNPFNPFTVIKYTVGGAGGLGLGARSVELKVYDVLGREVAALVNERQAPGHYTVPFDASRLASGVYFYRLIVGNYVDSKKALLLK
jgi:uncharacterized delta-60 repeat protein